MKDVWQIFKHLLNTIWFICLIMFIGASSIYLYGEIIKIGLSNGVDDYSRFIGGAAMVIAVLGIMYKLLAYYFKEELKYYKSCKNKQDGNNS